MPVFPGPSGTASGIFKLNLLPVCSAAPDIVNPASPDRGTPNSPGFPDTPTKWDIEQYKDTDPSLIVVIDSIRNPKLYRNSVKIRTEFNKYFRV